MCELEEFRSYVKNRLDAMFDSLNDFSARLDKIEAELKDDTEKAIDDFLRRADISDPLAPAKPKTLCDCERRYNGTMSQHSQDCAIRKDASGPLIAYHGDGTREVLR